MKKIGHIVSYSLFALLVLFSSCKKDKETVSNPSVPVDTLNYDLDESTLVAAGWNVEFRENFDANFNKWDIWEGGAYNNEYQCYSNASKNLKIANGILILTAKKETVNGATTPYNATLKSFDFTSARIESKNYYSANSSAKKMRFSARIKLPSGYGMWPAFWSYGNNWPTNGEIDALEAKGNLPFNYATNYFYGTTQGVNLVSGEDKTITASRSLVAYWHVYEVIWEETKLTYLLDGKVVDTKTGSYIASMFGKSQRIAVNLAVGGDYFGNPPVADIETGTMYVDWVKAFSKN